LDSRHFVRIRAGLRSSQGRTMRRVRELSAENSVRARPTSLLHARCEPGKKVRSTQHRTKRISRAVARSYQATNHLNRRVEAAFPKMALDRARDPRSVLGVNRCELVRAARKTTSSGPLQSEARLTVSSRYCERGFLRFCVRCGRSAGTRVGVSWSTTPWDAWVKQPVQAIRILLTVAFNRSSPMDRNK